jgi:menaquinol-cytochrome c reductase iron-sulfur subunit
MKEKETNKDISRRKFLIKVSMGLAALSAASVAIPVISALLSPLFERKKEAWRSIGQIDDFPTGTIKLVSFTNADPKSYAGVTAKSSAWLRHTDENTFIAFAANCTHLGCPVRWEEHAELFMCPCHGGVYYKDGSVAAGPPPKPLTRYEVRIHKNEVQLKTAPLPITQLNAGT